MIKNSHLLLKWKKLKGKKVEENQKLIKILHEDKRMMCISQRIRMIWIKMKIIMTNNQNQNQNQNQIPKIRNKIKILMNKNSFMKENIRKEQVLMQFH
jgi:hypothetical protein